MTPEQLLRKHGLQIGFKSTYSWDSIIAAMQEYANQSQSPAPVDAQPTQPNGDEVRRKIGAIKLGTLDGVITTIGIMGSLLDEIMECIPDRQPEIDALKKRVEELEGIVLPKFILVARHARNFPHPKIPITLLRSEGVQAEMQAENTLGRDAYESICEKSFNQYPLKQNNMNTKVDWISILDDEPSAGQAILVVLNNGFISIAYRKLKKNSHNWQLFCPLDVLDLGELDYVTHWAYLPEPPEFAMKKIYNDKKLRELYQYPSHYRIG